MITKAIHIKHVSCIIVLAILTRSFSSILLSLSNVPLFDTSPYLLNTSSTDRAPSATLRWDAIHFSSIALHGYTYEQQIAFQSGWPILMRLAGEVVRWWRGGGIDVEDVVFGGVVLANLAFVGAVVMLYELTSLLFSPSFAFITSCLYLLPPTPAVLSSAYTEPIFAFFTFSGYHHALKKNWLIASLLLAGSSMIRATGVFSSGVLVWLYVFRSDTSSRGPFIIFTRLVKGGIYSLIIISPFLIFQLYAYLSFCQNGTSRPWCHSHLPIAYSFVQKEYWNVGFLNYWDISQLPNLLISFPVIIISLHPTIKHLFQPSTLSSRLIPFHLHHLIMTFLLIFSSHTQISLRVISGDPVVWWNIAQMAFGPKGMTRWGKVWVWWVLIWGAISIPLWKGHYPPA
ncbi:hypothetical protein TREMEDRAFT_42227 [Tremella mesenterica DSM 1558]|uniref:uncharacterized protein n=1 Tax=Tremella mesenterica (strain ATCC 24925 / CBS 8224 / DSM 1558 / NBRC 9311 / NRRL Y-6157 / RJB 2259-6 / UBC 559-6) TaxID=578456 RepID=UPI0003F4A42A|nr:uncharacterized protein TREMEDRAFT_42227 [Tremella mesenterica DSM 1558]EIW73174.1 hypothetical protein TREMEDRAFT_42227 [Tremella mesenterica DSM 1558]